MSKHTKTNAIAKQTARKPHVLLIDDEEDITTLLTKTLERMAITVTTYNDPDEALRRYEPGKFDLVLLDMRMPGLNGFELLKSIRTIDAKVNVCFLTAFEIEREEFLRNDVEPDSINCFIKKPVHVSEFTKKVTALLEGP